jgi:thioester reductase-like protein
LLGLDEGEAERIFNLADVVIHNGADTSHMKGYLELRASNVGSTVTLARLCLPRRIPLHYVSSVGLAILHGEDEFPPVRIADGATPATDGSFGYGSAKWVCERILEQVHDLYNGDWSLCIHRPSTIIREGADAVGQKAELDWINALLRHARKSRTVPKINRNRGAIDLVSIQTACAAIIGPVMQPNKRMADKNVGYVHEVGDVVLPLNNLPELGRSESGGQLFEELPMDTWVSAAVADGMHPAVAALVEMMDEPGSAHYPRLLREEPW